MKIGKCSFSDICIVYDQMQEWGCDVRTTLSGASSRSQLACLLGQLLLYKTCESTSAAFKTFEQTDLLSAHRDRVSHSRLFLLTTQRSKHISLAAQNSQC